MRMVLTPRPTQSPSMPASCDSAPTLAPHRQGRHGGGAARRRASATSGLAAVLGAVGVLVDGNV